MRKRFLLCFIFICMICSVCGWNVLAAESVITEDFTNLNQILDGKLSLRCTSDRSNSASDYSSCTFSGSYPSLSVTVGAKSSKFIWTTTTTTTLILVNGSDIEITVTYVDGDTEKSEKVSGNGTLELKKLISSSSNTDWSYETVIIKKITWAVSSATASFNAVEGSGTFDQAGKTVELGEDGGLTYSAVPNSGWAFFGFRMSDGTYKAVNPTLKTGTVTNETISVAFTETVSGLTPIFVPAGTALFETSSSWYPYFDEAISAANSGSKLLSLACSGAVYSKDDVTEYTIPSGVTFVLPYQAGATTIEASSGKYPYANYTLGITSHKTSDSALAPESNVTYTLTVPAGTTVVNNGTIAIGGIIHSYSSVAGATGGAHSNLVLESGATLKMGNDAILSVCGYILGDGEIDVTSSGAKVYQPFVVCDFKGGGYVVGVAGQLEGSYGLENQPGDETCISPFLRYSLRNIQTKLTLGGASTMYGYCDLYTASRETHNQCTFAVAGADGILKLKDSTVKMVAEYKKDEIATGHTQIGRTYLTVIGDGVSDPANSPDASLGGMVMKITVLGSVGATIDSSKIVFPVPYNFSIRLTDGEFTIGNPMKLMPGAELLVDTDATLNLQSTLIIYDQLFDCSTVSSSELNRTETQLGNYPYPQGSALKSLNGNESANFIVNGTFNIQSGATFGGLIQTAPDSTGSSVVQVETGATLGTTVRNGGVGTYTFLLVQKYYLAAATVHTVDAKIYDIGTGEIVTLSAGNTYYGLADSSSKANPYAYNFYGNSTDTSTYTSKSDILSGTYLGGWYTHVDVYYDHTQTEVQEMLYYVTKPDSPEQIELSVGEWDDGTFKYNSNNEWTDFTGSAPSVNHVTYRNLSMGTEKTGFVLYSDSTRTERDIVEKYRLNDYIWLNANFFLGTKITPSKSNLSIATEGSGNAAELVVINNQVYIVMKIYSDDLANEWKFTLTYTDGNLQLDETITLSLADYAEELSSSPVHYELLQAMIEYGKASNAFFNGGTASALATFDGVTTPVSEIELLYDMRNKYNGVQLDTYGATVYFDNCLSLALMFKTTDAITLNEGDEIVQIGILVGTDKSELSAESYEKAYILYGTTDDTQNGADNTPGVDGQSASTISGYTSELPTDLTKLMTVSFDLTTDEYLQRFSLRPFLVIQHSDGTYTNLYGEQYLYGFEDYCARTYEKETAKDESRNLVVYAWKYALKAKAAFPGE